jgi:outer membrane protein assembly factor BamA
MRSIPGSVLSGLVLLAACSLPLVATAAETKIEVHSLTFVGVRGVSQGALRDALATRVSSRIPFLGRQHLFDRARFEADLERIRAYYLDHGFPDARVTSFDVKLDQQQTRVDITIHVSEGEPTKLTALRFEGFGAVPAGRMAYIKRTAAVKPGDPLDKPATTATHEMAVNALRDYGYPYARVAIDEEKGPDPHNVTLTFRAQPGPLAYFGDTQVVGNRTVDDWVVQREMLFRPGDLYRRRLVQESQRKLYDIELFEFVNVQPVKSADVPVGTAGEGREAAGADGLAPVPQIEAPITVPMRVTLTEGKHRRVRFSVGYGTEEKVRGEIHYDRLNFLGGARTASVQGRWSSLDRGVRVQLRQPFFWSPRLSLDLIGQRWYDDEPGYTSVASGGHATLSYRPGTQNTLSMTFTDEYDSSTVAPSALADPLFQKQLIGLGIDPTTGTQTGTLVALSFDGQRSTSAPNPLNATRGYSIDLHFERAAQVLHGSFSYYGASFDVRHYQRLSDRLVIASRLQAGTIDPSRGLVANVPFSKRYYLGGATSIRGWGRYEVSPLSNGTPVGGFSMVEATTELRMAVRGQLGLVAFLDVGNVWPGAWQFPLSDLRYAIGPGLRYNTPVGPLRIDLGYQLNPIPGLTIDGKPETRQWRVHFSIGQAF